MSAVINSNRNPEELSKGVFEISLIKKLNT
jgi:hypothetical protein